MTQYPPTDVSTVIIRDSFATIVSVDDNVAQVLGWHPHQLVGRPSTEFVHPEDQPGALVTWFQMMDTPGEPICLERTLSDFRRSVADSVHHWTSPSEPTMP